KSESSIIGGFPMITLVRSQAKFATSCSTSCASKPIGHLQAVDPKFPLFYYLYSLLMRGKVNLLSLVVFQ
ncbi:hypothetical protein ACM6Q7_28075, partial [Peribacillus butanolivorans]|uniref:hypothetical protein n=1 Tax=Peribacillus butanolivorans TaxID=421767 RepID=UPI0039FC1920